jgi:hypothetical protein
MNLVYYGAKESDKYSFMINTIQPNLTKNCKLIDIEYNNDVYSFKKSHYHCEFDASFIKHKNLFIEMLNVFIDLLKNNEICQRFIVCNNFHEINNDILPIIYLFMQNVNIQFILLTESISFINHKILSNCIIHTVSGFNPNKPIIQQYKNICNVIIKQIINPKSFTFFKFRITIYNLLIYNLDIHECIWYIIYEVNKVKKISDEFIQLLPDFFSKFYHCYKPIYNLEFIFMNLFREFQKK